MTEPTAPTPDQIQQEIQEIAEVLLREHPPDTPIADVWDEALTLYRVRFETEVLPPPSGIIRRTPKR